MKGTIKEMNEMVTYRVVRLLNNERGAEIAEVGIWLALIVALAIGAIGTIGGQVKTAFENVRDAITTALAT